MAKLDNIHPGEVLYEEFLKPLGISAYRLSKNIGIPQTRISEILKGKRITADTALRLSNYFGSQPNIPGFKRKRNKWLVCQLFRVMPKSFENTLVQGLLKAVLYSLTITDTN